MNRELARRHAIAVALVAVGGSTGATLRYAAELGVGHSLFATLLVNVTGCFLLGLLLFDARAGEVLSKRVRLVFGTGFCSSFTTYSTFVLDAVTSSPGTAVGYVLASYGCGFAAVVLARFAVDAFGRTPVRRPVRGGG